MKFTDENIKKFEQDAYDPFDFSDEVFTDEMGSKGGFISEHPAAAVLAGAGMLAAPLIGIGMTGAASHAAELPQNQDVQATYVDTVDSSDSKIVETVDTIADKVVNFTTSGPGHIEPVENCTIDGETGEIRFTNPDANASFKLVYDVEGATSSIEMGNFSLPADTNFVMLEAHSGYGTININFDDSLVQQQAADEAARAAEEQARVEEQARLDAERAVEAQRAAEEQQQAQAAAPAQVQQAAPAQVQQTQQRTQSQAQPQTQTQNKQATSHSTAKKVTTTTTTTKKVVTSSHKSSNATPASGAPRHSMNAEEKAVARQIFDAYNNYRASKGLSKVAWSEDCANMAYGSSTGCAAHGGLTHRLGIPVAVQRNYSDILQYSTWKMSGNEAVQRWSQSTGHRKMMQCTSTSAAGVAAYKDASGVWYYTIVYNFQGTNQGGN